MTPGPIRWNRPAPSHGWWAAAAVSGARLGAAAVGAGLVATLFAGCSRPPKLEPTQVTLGSVSVRLQVPQGWSVHSGTADKSCPHDYVIWFASDAILSVRATGSTLAGDSRPGCPHQRPLNGHLPVFPTVEQLPPEAVDVPAPPEAARARQVTLTYTECSNHCTSRPVVVTVIEPADRRQPCVTLTTDGLAPELIEQILYSIRVG